MKERRAYDRTNLYGKLMLHAPGQSQVEAFLEDICFSGLGFLTFEKMDLDRTVTFSLTTDASTEPLQGTGRIRFVREPDNPTQLTRRTGLEIVDTNKDELQYLINRAQSKVFKRDNQRKMHAPIDFIPY